MKKNIILAIFFGIASLYAFSINPIDPPAKTGDDVKTPGIIPTAAPQDECSDLFSMVNVKVRITFTDCPNYPCTDKPMCTFRLVILQNGSIVGNAVFYPDICFYEIDVRVDNNILGGLTYMLVAEPTVPPCPQNYNSNTTIFYYPLSGGTVTLSTTFC